MDISGNMNDIEPVMLGGLGEKVSNGGTQYYNQDRVYDSRSVSVTISTVLQPWYLVKCDDRESIKSCDERKMD